MVVLIFFLTAFFISLIMYVSLYLFSLFVRAYVMSKYWFRNRKQTKYVNWLKRTDIEIKDMLK